MADDNKRLQMFGKTFATVGDVKTNLCLCTLGDVKIKTANRFVTIFKNGKLNVDDSTEIFAVNSLDEVTKTGVYLVTTTDDDGNESQAVYLDVDGVNILLANSADGYISYTSVQELTATQFLQALENIGYFFNTLEAAQNSGITDGLVYVLETQTLYKCVNGDFVDIISSTCQALIDANKEEQETYTELQIGSILIDGNSRVITADGDLTIQVNGIDYLLLRGNKIYVRKDVVLNSDITVQTQNAEQGESGLLIYRDEDSNGITLEVDNLIVHNASANYEPSLQEAYIGSAVCNLITSASWSASPTDVELALKYDNNFATGDIIAVHTAGGNQVSIDTWTDTDGVWWVGAGTDGAVGEDGAEITIYYVYYVDEDDEGTEGSVTLTLEDVEDEDDEGNTVVDGAYGEAALNVPKDIEGLEITGMTDNSGSNLYWDEDGAEHYFTPNIYIGTVKSDDPFVISLPDQKNQSDTVLKNLEWGVIYRLKPADSTEYVLWREGQDLSLRTYSSASEYDTALQIGDLSDYGYFGQGIYSDKAIFEDVEATKIVASDAEISNAVLNETLFNQYPECSDTLDVPSDFDSDSYNSTIPTVEWVKKLIEAALVQP